jgi:hypothetical protein
MAVSLTMQMLCIPNVISNVDSNSSASGLLNDVERTEQDFTSYSTVIQQLIADPTGTILQGMCTDENWSMVFATVAVTLLSALWGMVGSFTKNGCCCGEGLQ